MSEVGRVKKIRNVRLELFLLGCFVSVCFVVVELIRIVFVMPDKAIMISGVMAGVAFVVFCLVVYTDSDGVVKW